MEVSAATCGSLRLALPVWLMCLQRVNIGKVSSPARSSQQVEATLQIFLAIFVSHTNMCSGSFKAFGGKFGGSFVGLGEEV